METQIPGTPERLGGKPRESAEDAFATFMDMSESEWSQFRSSAGVPHGLTPAEQQGYLRACITKRFASKPESDDPEACDPAHAPCEEILAVQPETITTPEGYVITEEGEIIRHIDQPFAVVDRNSAEWVLQRLMDADAAIFAETARLTAVTEHIQARMKEQTRRRDWLRARFAHELEQYAAGQLVGQKARTLVLDHGKISFRRTSGSTQVLDMAAAVEWAKQNAPESLKITESVLVSPLKDRNDLPEAIFEVTPPGDRCSIETGIKEIAS